MSEVQAVPHEFREVDQGEWRRELYGYERGVWLVEQEDSTLTIIVELTAQAVSCKELSDAWSLLPLAVPMVYTRIVRGGGSRNIPQLAYTVPQDASQDLARWTAKTVHEQEHMQLQELSRLAASRKPAAMDVDDHHVARLFMSATDAGSVNVVLAVLHSVVDGRGAWIILDALLSLLAKKPSLSAYDWGVSHVGRLPIPIQFATGIRRPREGPAFNVMEYFAKMRKDEAEMAPFTSFQLTPPETPLDSTALATVKGRIVIPAADYDVVHSIAKSKGVTATAWLSVCAALATMALNNVEDARTLKLRNASPDGRWRLTQDFLPYLGMSIFIGALDIKKVAGLRRVLTGLKEGALLPPPFWELAQENTDAYQKLKHDDASLSIADELVQVLIGMLAGDRSSFDKAGTSFISLGKVHDFIKSEYEGTNGQVVSLHDFRTFPTLGRRRLISIHAFQFKGDLHITWQASRHFYSDDFIAQFEETMQSIFKKIVELARI